MKFNPTIRGPVFVEFGCQDTRRNLPRGFRTGNQEAHFLRCFERHFLASEAGPVVAGREFALDGFGRADLVWLAWEANANNGDFSALALKKRLRLTAIEGKMSDWRKGLHQAFRYRYFAHRSLLVLPLHTANVASHFLPTFRRLRVGLWGFDPTTGRLKKWFTPRSRTPMNGMAWQKALHLFESNLHFSKLLEGS